MLAVQRAVDTVSPRSDYKQAVDAEAVFMLCIQLLDTLGLKPLDYFLCFHKNHPEILL